MFIPLFGHVCRLFCRFGTWDADLSIVRYPKPCRVSVPWFNSQVAPWKWKTWKTGLCRGRLTLEGISPTSTIWSLPILRTPPAEQNVWRAISETWRMPNRPVVVSPVALLLSDGHPSINRDLCTHYVWIPTVGWPYPKVGRSLDVLQSIHIM